MNRIPLRRHGAAWLRVLFRWSRRTLVVLCLLLLGPIGVRFFGDLKVGDDHRTASRVSTGIAPRPEEHPEAIIQVYAARAFSWRGMFAVHTWIAAKPPNAAAYSLYQVVGWRVFRGLPAVSVTEDIPDRLWFDNAPEILSDLRGPAAEAVLGRVDEAVRTYPHPDEYVLWPGPNSNTFVAHVGRLIPELQLELPVTAIGKDYLAGGNLFGRAPSGTGYQLSLWGIAGVIVAKREGLEINLLGLAIGVNPLGPSIQYPGWGRIGF